MSDLMISLTDYHVSHTLGYIDTNGTFPDVIGGTSAGQLVQIPLSAEIAQAEAALNALLCAAVKTELLKRPGADPTLDVTPFKNANQAEEKTL